MTQVFEHFIDIRQPHDFRLVVLLDAEEDVHGLQFQQYGPLADHDEMALHRAVSFSAEMLLKLRSQDKLVEDLQRHLKSLQGFELEYAIVKAVAELQAERYRLCTPLVRKGAA